MFSKARNDVTLKNAAEIARKLCKLSKHFYPVIMVKNVCMHTETRIDESTYYYKIVTINTVNLVIVSLNLCYTFGH